MLNCIVNVSRKAGLTLIELIVAMTIISLLAVLGIPSYQTYMIESRRSDAINTLLANQLLVENYLYENGETPANAAAASLATQSPAEYYTLSYVQVSDQRYRLVATAVNGKSQQNDTGCTTITLTSEMNDVYPSQCH